MTFLNRLLLALCLLGLSGFAASATTTADREIDALITSVAQLKGATFIRNGSEHSAADAASHLQLKRRNAGKRIQSAEDFIRYCATGSSLSGKPYQIRLANGQTIASADFFRARLSELRAAAAPSIKKATAG